MDSVAIREELKTQISYRTESNYTQLVGQLVVRPIVLFTKLFIYCLTLGDDQLSKTEPQIGSEFPFEIFPLNRSLTLRIGLYRRFLALLFRIRDLSRLPFSKVTHSLAPT